jgi:uncharacterized RDD family membrane protein YckC
MSAPTTGSANGSPVPGYYPDPSIPGYIRYWNGSGWVPGTSRPAPAPGEPAPAPPNLNASGQVVANRPEPAPAPEEQPDEEDDGDDVIDLGRASNDSGSLPEVRRRGEVAAHGQEHTAWDDPRRLHGAPPEPASAWQADPSQQSGFGGEQQPDLSWGTPESGAAPAHGAHGQEIAPGGHDPRGGWAGAGNAGEPASGGASGGAPQVPSQQTSPDHTVGIRMPRPKPPESGGGQSAAQPEHTVGLRRSDVFQYGAGAAGAGNADAPPQQGYQGASAQAGYGQNAGHAEDLSAGQGASRPPWEQQVHDLAQQAPGQVPGQGHAPGGHAGPGLGVPPQQGGAAMGPGTTPWRPPTADPFADAVQDARPAGLGKRLGARLIDGLLASAVLAAVAFPFVGKTTEHIEGKIEAANQAGVTRTIWLVDGTTGVYLAVVLGAFLLFGLLYEALPTAKWGRTLGKKLFGLRVLDVERQDAPGFGAALRRWLTYSVLSLIVLGVVNVLWCLFDRPWRQCWHDKAARTFVAGG